MASNFRILINRNSDNLNLKLTGDFDGTSACELLNALRDNCDGTITVFVNTSRLKDIHPFGRDTFRNSLYLLKDLPINLIFTGEKATSIAPERNGFF